MYLRGQIYKFIGKNQDKSTRYALVVSCDERSRDGFINILICGHLGKGIYVSEVDCNGEKYRVNCSMVTYCLASQLGEYIGMADDMGEVDLKIAASLGLPRYELAAKALMEIMGNVKEKA